ncbi:glycosyltransferase [Kutzneria buriramensis]|uniref:UDP:flavonoid glycosyltransferase YjiC (YdhE family) n=1 Tax=Kutzneria buriramensis TaxID=1045776 RepID=A0A3E0HI81_9PSEU|nr:glycosyltransferase [Kutzneria buriramensis]REH46147.1 UDP:flavonoid glycosyltransferase YjiC (YdhE family) [Kutzneria buriramensis]
MSHVLIIAVGSRGDVEPYTGVGAGLRAVGHRVTIAADREFEHLVTGTGLEFRPLWTQLSSKSGAVNETSQNYTRNGLFSRNGMDMIAAARQFIRETNINVAEIAADPSVDVVLFNGLGAAAYHVAQARGIPSVGLHLQPQLPTADFPPMVFGTSLGRLGIRAAWVAHRLTERSMFGNINEIRAQHGLPPTTYGATRREQAASAWPVLHGFSQYVVPRPREWRPGVEVVGYWWPSVPASWTPPEKLRRFLDAGPAPVFVGFGSADPGDAARVSGIVAGALRSVGRRGIIQTGWAGLAVEDDDVLTIGEVPHAWLFPRMAVVVHPGGAGTTAAGLRAGVPAVPVPMTGDHPFWAARLTALGVSPGPVPFKHLTKDRLADAIRAAVDEPRYERAAKSIAAKVATEDGAAEVAHVVERLDQRGVSRPAG